ncbi:hypothetical protein [Nitrospira moscoviensis]|uniref:PD-(D/E)XK endonuclease-like domain-containing protein n=1 Tax=Nitrospira moscoviensis TaxID=42253 RepID=A0A0K2GAK6_NITMO|nr:hypothetical protein [Nitrospira moscoviensis]ALA58001.1 hypothetical protein NITMOv2_1577 [Nitrospira moscoviensis]
MLAELIHPLAAMGAQNWPYRPRPSSAGPNHCLRKLVYHAREFPRKQAHGRFLVVLDDSSWHEELTLNWIEQSAFQLRDRQTEVICGETIFQGEPYTILGHIDGIVTDLLGIDRLLEHKAIEHFTFQRYAEGDYPLDYFAQVCFYLHGISTLNPDIDEALLLIKNKNQSAYLEYRLRYDLPNDRLTVVEVVHSNGERSFLKQEVIGLYQQALARFTQVEQYRVDQTLPDRPYDDDSDYHCQYCPYSRLCWEGHVAPALTNTVALSTEMAALAAEYLELEGRIKPLTKRFDQLKKLLKAGLKAEQAVEGAGHGFVVRINQSTQTRHDVKLLPSYVQELAETTLPIEKLSVSRALAQQTRTVQINPDPRVA